MILFLIIFLFLTFLIGFIIDLILYKINVVKIDSNADNLLGFILGTLISFLLISVLFLCFQLIPIQETARNEISSRANESTLYTFCNNIKYLLLSDDISQ